MAKNFTIVVWAKDGCSYCAEVKEYLTEQQLDFKIVDVTNHDDYRDILELKYGVRHVPVVEIGRDHQYRAITEVGIENLQIVLQEANEVFN
ncbi:glutaredoxin family protein [Lysinibacillus yapensis]|uniref:Glutaredoxin family protein n=1 Tax=Ureibacillus yapensis TaxID=2304605 RepID=A0A396S4W7_9BACL|nr:glutaredoxin family protein [Lysinibacillus yapensis]RHW34733.1 glutaredoxin family protein [Lysinibacillus yapensis]